MDIKVPRGKYVLAVSGGVDSMTLLDLLSNLPGVNLVLAYFNHGIRSDSDEDEKLVAEAAGRYGWKLEIGRGGLGPKASEATARHARYEFLEANRQNHQAAKIITAHHQDDLIETALINLLRGTGRHGLTAMSNNQKVLRPLLGISKSEILEYANQNGLAWLEDSTNQSLDFLRNYIRIKTLPKLNNKQKERLIADLARISRLNFEIDKELELLDRRARPQKDMDRQIFSLLPDNVADELLVYWLRAEQLGEIDRYEVSRLKLALKTAKPATVHPIKGANRLVIKGPTANFYTTS